MSANADPWDGQNPLGCCRNNRTEGGVLTHGGPDCQWPGPPVAPREPWRWYLPLNCPTCGRRRLEYRANDDGNVVQVRCEKCGFDSDD